MRLGLLLISLVLITAGIALGLASTTRGGSAREILGRRLASGEISIEEYRERLAALGRSERSSQLIPAALLISVGLTGVIVSITAFFGRGMMQNMIGGMMSGGMGSMMRGRTDLSAPQPSPEASDVVVIAKEFVFSPREITVQSGRTVNLVIENDGEAFHTLTIEELEFQIEAQAGRRLSGALTVERPGNYRVTCSVSGHTEAGMRATLVVK